MLCLRNSVQVEKQEHRICCIVEDPWLSRRPKRLHLSSVALNEWQIRAAEQITLQAIELASSAVPAEAGKYPAALRILARVSRSAGSGHALRMTTVGDLYGNSMRPPILWRCAGRRMYSICRNQQSAKRQDAP